MPNDQSIGFAQASENLRAIGRKRDERKRLKDERERERLSNMALARLNGISPDSDPDIWKSVESGQVSGEDAVKVIKSRRSQDAAMTAQRQDLDMSLANRSVEDPNASRMNLDIGAFKPNLGSQGMSMPQRGAPVSGGMESPNAGMAMRGRELAQANPSMTPTERTNVMRSEMRPGDEGVAGVAGRSLSISDDRKKAVNEQDAEAAWQQFSQGLQGGGGPMQPDALKKMGAGFGDMAKYTGMNPKQMQQRALEGEPNEGPKWSKEDQQTVRLLEQQGIPENDARFPQAFTDAKKKGGVTQGQQRTYDERVKFAEIEKMADNVFPKDDTGQYKQAKKDWIRNNKLDWLKQNPLNADPLASQLQQLLEAEKRLDAAIDAELSE